MIIKLSELEWHEGKPDMLRPGMVLDEGGGEPTLVGDINDETGSCSCCGSPVHPKRWAMLEFVP